jgi:Fe-S-cluster containining protein
MGRIRMHLGLPQADRLDKRYFRRAGLRHSLREKPDGDCIFLKREGGATICAIYPVRPTQCRTWPFWSHNLRSPNVWNGAHQKCPGMGTGRHHDFDQIEALRTQKSS